MRYLKMSVDKYDRSFANYGEKRYAIIEDGDAFRVAKVTIIQTISHNGIVKFYECDLVDNEETEKSLTFKMGGYRLPKKMVGRDRRRMEKLAFTLSLKGAK
jgi:hypothetical protein